jgi:hypothetical protein
MEAAVASAVSESSLSRELLVDCVVVSNAYDRPAPVQPTHGKSTQVPRLSRDDHGDDAGSKAEPASRSTLGRPPARNSISNRAISFGTALVVLNAVPVPVGAE